MVRARSREGKWWRGQSLLVLWVVIVAGFMLLDDIREISGAGYIAPGAGRGPWTGPLERLGIDAITVFAGPSRSVAASVSAQSRRGRNPVAFTPSGHHHDEIPRPTARWRDEPVIRPFCIDGGRSVWLLFRTTCVSRAVS